MTGGHEMAGDHDSLTGHGQSLTAPLGTQVVIALQYMPTAETRTHLALLFGILNRHRTFKHHLKRGP